MDLSLTELANRYGSDKGDEVGDRHGYTEFYAFLCEQWTLDAFTMLEIGLQRGDTSQYRDPKRPVDDLPSIRMWLDYFPEVQCWGFDIADFRKLELPRFTFVQGDMSSVADLGRLSDAMPAPRLIIDDGSHASYHQQMAFLHLFPHVEPGGFYIIEDLQFQPPYEVELPKCRKTKEMISVYLASGTLDIPFASSSEQRFIEQAISSVFVLREPSTGRGPGQVKLVCLQKRGN